MILVSSTLFRGWQRTGFSSFTTACMEGNGSDGPNSIGKRFNRSREAPKGDEHQVLRITCAEVSRGGFIARGRVWDGCKVPGWWTESYPADEAQVTLALPSD